MKSRLHQLTEFLYRTEVMGARFIVLLCHTLFTYSLTVNREGGPHIISKSKVELTPLFASTRLNDIVIISAPIINAKDVYYYLNKPNGDTITLDIKRQTKNRKKKFKYLTNDIVVKHIKGGINAVIKPLNHLQMFSTKLENFTAREEAMGVNDFALGPLMEEDHGNWVLSVYYEDLDGNWIELFQVITIEIVDIIPPELKTTVLEEGDVFKPSFPYPIKDLESCELIAPNSTFDRLYDRSHIEFNKCGYVVENITKRDAGPWTIIGVGKIIYETQFMITVLNRTTR